jgi:hypothetical protein
MTGLEDKQTIEVKRLRPWVRYTGLGVLTLAAYVTLKQFLLKPQPYVVQFDLKKIQDMKKQSK